jgi:uncharacterized DUF497 family protein
MNGEGLEFEWDEANKGHIARHGVAPMEAEEALLRDTLDIEMQFANASDGEERLLHLGETAKGRILQIVTTWRGGQGQSHFRMGRTRPAQAVLLCRNEATIWKH